LRHFIAVITARRLIVLCVLAGVLAGGGVALAGSGGGGGGPIGPPGFVPKNKAAAEHLRLERQAIDLINAASRHVQATVKGCKLRFPPSRSVPTHDAPTPPVLDAIAALRRPATPSELADGKQRRGFGGETYVDYVRHVTTANGRRLTIVIGRSVRDLLSLPSRCYDAEHRYLVEHLAGQPHKLRSVTLEEFSHIRQGQQANNHQQSDTPVDGIYLFDKGGGGGGADIASFHQRGVFGSSGGANSGSRLDGLVPDGVATITLQFPKTISRGKYYKPTIFAHAFTKTIAVHDNVISVWIPRDAPDAFPHHMFWRDAAGAVINDFTDPNF
jgi:hypothetical protein